MGRFGFLLVLAMFGALMFVAGALAPASLTAPLRSLAASAQKLASVKAPPAAVALSAAKAAAAADASGSATAAAKPDPIPLENLLLPATPTAKGQYGLQLGQFEHSAEAQQLHERLRIGKFPGVVLETVDQDGRRWSVVASGPYPSQDLARAARAPLVQVLGVTGPMPVIQWPAPVKQN
jgi:cell division septation protein DedD